MSVPRYIWRWDARDFPITHYADPVSGGNNFDVKAHPDAIKYLCTALTCGDCGRERRNERQNYVASRGQSLGTNWVCDLGGLGSHHPMSHYPACMAIVPKGSVDSEWDTPAPPSDPIKVR